MSITIELNPDLPFAVFGEDGRIAKFWNVHPSGDWSEDNWTGREFAKLALQFVSENDRPIMMRRMLQEMMGESELSGIAVGFIQELTEKAVLGMA